MPPSTARRGRAAADPGTGTGRQNGRVTEPDGSIRRFYTDWEQYNQRITDVVRAMTAEQLAIRPSPGGWPIWATVAHTAGARAYWLCGVFGEPGLEQTPFTDIMSGMGWEDDPDHPRDAAELAGALESTWLIVASVLDRWTPASLSESVVRDSGGRKSVHTRASVLNRLFTHDAYHAGELSQTLGIHKLPQIDLWA
jgi:uncharacterized damage-inducible protein DinB